MKKPTQLYITLLFAVVISACGNSDTTHDETESHGHGEAHEEVVVKGPHGGRLLRSDGFQLELSIFETGVPPEFRAWASLYGQPLKPDEVELNIKLQRLGGKVDDINFTAHGDAMRGDSVIYEPHSFIVTINALHNNVKHTWQYDNFEGRTRVETAVAEALSVETSVAGAAVLQETIEVYGKIKPNPEAVRNISARFSGVIKSVLVSMGDSVTHGQTLATIESNESLKVYAVKSPIDGVLTRRNANPGEQAGNQQLFTVIDTSDVWVELSLFPEVSKAVKVGSQVTLEIDGMQNPIRGRIATINITAEANQSVAATMIADNSDGLLIPNRFIRAKIKIAEHAVPLAVRRAGLQSFRDFTVVYAKVGEEYEVRMLDLGRVDDEWVEVLGGLEPGTRYVSENSYIIKADIEKSGASHDH